ncbi:uncharacterized protein LOC115231265 [Octopus sinensis]|uniref:Uncharacterized protein LOC115231265 n=1 Tax=Octopus sinensis TaxID=2607531 RepID=A0A6P7U4H4_9MOLL|nr:uncharacterized protein LOC115231265 [Octopus sinensis]
MGKEDDLFKAVKQNDYYKLQKTLFADRSHPSKKKDRPNNQANVIALHSNGVNTDERRRPNVNVDCHEAGTGYTPLILAVLNQLKEISQLLLASFADPNEQDFKGNTALHMAVFCGRADLMELLLQNGSKVNIQNSDGNTPLHIACQCDCDNRVLVMLKLLTAGANIQMVNKVSATPLDVAAMYNKKDAVSTLLDHDKEALKGNSLALVEASIRGYAPIVEMLLKYGINPNVVNKLKETAPLHEAIRFFRLQVAERLLQYGAKTDVANPAGETPLKMVKDLPRDRPNEFQRLFDEYSTGELRRAHVQFNSSFVERRKKSYIKKYPELENNMKWTENSPSYCSCCTAMSPNTNILDNDNCSFWVIPSIQQAWTVLDLQHEHIITGIKVFGWDSPNMVKNFELRKGYTIEGPWSTVVHFACKSEGSSDPKDPGKAQIFDGFSDSSRFWQLLIIDNHGGSCICFQGINLYGAEKRIFTELEQMCFSEEFANRVVQKGFNTYKKFLEMKESDLKTLLPNIDQVRHMLMHLGALKIKEYPLLWKKPPITEAEEGSRLPRFIVQSAGNSDMLEIIVNGATIGGCIRSQLLPCKDSKMNVAIFDDIKIFSSGTFLITVQSVLSPNIHLKAPDPIHIKRPARTAAEVEAAFDEIQLMLHKVAASLDDTIDS